MGDRVHTLSGGQRAFLEGLFPGEAVFTPEEALVFGADSSRLFAPPLAVVRPGGEEQVRELLSWADKERVPLFVRARGTNMVGDCVPALGGVVVSTLKLNRILEVDEDDFVAVSQPGVVTADLQRAVEARGLFYPPDPASLRVSTIGGNVSTCAGGMRAVKYGVTRDYVLGLKAVLPGGDTIQTGGRAHKNVVGLDLTRLLVGSEGTLAFISELTLKLLPKPQGSASLLAGYETLDQALLGARSIFRAGILPTAMELMAEEVLDCVGAVSPTPWPGKVRGALLLKIDGDEKTLGPGLDRLRGVVESSGPVYLAQGIGPEEEEPLWELRRLINPASFQIRPDKISEDIAVPRGKVRQALAGIREISRKHSLPILTFGHLGDGNIHVNIMHDSSKEGEVRAAKKAKDDLLGLVLGLSGTISGEHGIGLAKVGFVDRQLGSRELELMRSIKRVFDPNSIMNPGKAY